ncbi:hypothetical protein QBC36DRAFT_316210 [Triangularia setosa]|uniref:BTB domain-containing protein n=1 Tax=Triangularia setosa TaxID=2587417 RepID=A0AAN7A0P3_9PEZI|nr:hypothetical protein QBC36DRAFT_316210 [Podospora setosa]
MLEDDNTNFSDPALANLILQVGSNPTKELMVRAESLKHCSPYFETACSDMRFGDLTGTQAHRLCFPQDDPDVFCIMLCVIATRFSEVSSFIKRSGFTAILKLMMIAKKYFSLQILSPWVQPLVFRMSTSLNQLNDQELVNCALILRELGEIEVLSCVIYILAHFARKNKNGDIFLAYDRSSNLHIQERYTRPLKDCLHGLYNNDGVLDIICRPPKSSCFTGLILT